MNYKTAFYTAIVIVVTFLCGTCIGTLSVHAEFTLNAKRGLEVKVDRQGALYWVAPEVLK